MATELTQEFFISPAVRVRGLEPVSPNPYAVGRIPALRPLFVWSAVNGGRVQPIPDVHYELSLTARGDKEPTRFRTDTTRFVPPVNLDACETYRWQVRAHYTSFGTPAQSDWTPEYRFKTPCRKRDR